MGSARLSAYAEAPAEAIFLCSLSLSLPSLSPLFLSLSPHFWVDTVALVP